MSQKPKSRPASPPPAEEQLTPRLKEIVRAVNAKLDAEDEAQRPDETQPAQALAPDEAELRQYAGQIRHNLIEQVLSDVDDFIGHSQPLDLWFLHEVLFAHDQGHFWASGSLLAAFFEVAPETDAPQATLGTLRTKAA